MSACGGLELEHIFEKPLPENPTLVQSFSPWSHNKSMKPVDESSFTEMFGDLHFKEKLVNLTVESSSSEEDYHKEDISGGSSTDQEQNKSPISSSYYMSSQRQLYKHSHSFSSESLSLCTEGLGLESFDDVEDSLKVDAGDKEWQHQEGRTCSGSGSTIMISKKESPWSEPRRSRRCRGVFPPPISCIGRSGKPWVCFKSYRENGKFILKEIRIPTQEFLHAFRENGRLRLQFVQSDDEVVDDDEEDAEEEETLTDNGDEDDKQQDNIIDQEQRV